MAPRRSGRFNDAKITYAKDPTNAELSDDSPFDDVTGQRKRKAKKRVSSNIDCTDVEYAQEDSVEEETAEAGDGSPEDGDVRGSSSAKTETSEEDEETHVEAASGKRKVSAIPSEYAIREGHYNALEVAPDEVHSRGTFNPVEHVAKTVHLRLTFGTDERDLLAMIYARDRWFRGIDAGLPTRASLNEAEAMDNYGPGQTFGVAPEEIGIESTRGWDWYYDKNTGGKFRRRQNIEKIQKGEAQQKYLPQPRTGRHTVIIGPVDNQMVFELGQGDALDFGEAWSKAKAQEKKPQEPTGADATSEAASTTPMKEQRVREGWVLNLGNKIQCLAWAPNQGGLIQYLAVAVPITESQKEAYQRLEEPRGAPAFTPSEPFPAALQIWTFKAAEGDTYTRNLDMNFTPQLRQIISTNWGDLRRISWCPMRRAQRKEDDQDGSYNLGLLAGIWGDGSIKILDIKLSEDARATEYLKVNLAAFSSKPPSTVCTCVAWLSPSDIAVGCANGFVAIWSIASSPLTEPNSDPIPYLYIQLHSTYILGISSAYPQYPHLLGTTSMDGQTRLTSILDPQKDMVESTRMRIGSMHMSYSPILQAFLSNDENDFVRLLAIRRFYTTTIVARLPSTVSTLAPCSVWHPSGLLGCTGGTVIAVNPLRRLLYPKEKHWHLIWFAHECVRNQARDSSVSRFFDGFRAESVSLLRSMMTDRRRMVNGTMTITIFEEGTHITALAWNPNQRCAGWASAGMGSGLVRVEDLAI